MKAPEQNIINFTSSAVERIRQVQTRNNGGFLRITFSEGGCAGTTYGLSFAKNKSKDDIKIGQDGLALALINSDELDKLQNCTIDFVKTLSTGKFEISNPNTKAMCRCGSSFRI